MVTWMARDFVYQLQPDDVLAVLEDDPDRAPLLAQIEDVLASLSDNPGNPQLGTKVWATEVDHQVVRTTPIPGFGWYVVWTMATVEADIEIIHIGPENPDDQ
jgi:hypothetical protein